MPGPDGGYRLPANVHPPTFCMTLEVPDDPQYIASLAGALWELQFWWNWERDNAHTAREVTSVWRHLIQAAFDRINAGHLCPVPSFVNIAEMEYEMSICEQLRFQDGKLQGLCCGEWTDIAGQEGLVLGGPGQEGGGARQPDPGGCQSYHAQFQADSTWLLPTVVSAGDVLNFSHADGSGGDGVALSAYYCPDGGSLFSGNCLAIYVTDGADPAPAISHMAFIAKIGAVYYPAFSGSITVPVGISNEPVVIQVNDHVMNDNSGSYSLDVEVCNNAPENWCRTINFALTDGGFTIQSNPLDNIVGVYTIGTGFTHTQANNPSNIWRRGVKIVKMVTGLSVTRMVVTCQYTKGITDLTSDSAQYVDDGVVALVNVPFSAAVDGANVTLDTGIIVSTPTAIDIALICDRQSASNAGFSGSAAIKSLTVYGTGTPPSWGSPC